MQEKILQNFAFFIFWFWLIFLGHKKCRSGENLTAGTSCFFNDIILVSDNDTKLSEPGRRFIPQHTHHRVHHIVYAIGCALIAPVAIFSNAGILSVRIA